MRALCWSLLVFLLALSPLAGAQEGPPRPRVFKVGGGQGELTGLGTVRCRHTMELSFTVSGRLRGVAVTEGQEVSQGQELARLESQVLAADRRAKLAELAENQTQVERLEARLRDLKGLVASGAATRSQESDTSFELAGAQARMTRLRAELDGLDSQLAQRILRAPRAGQVLALLAEPGEVVTPGSKVLRMGQCRRLLAEVEVGERFYARLKKGQAARVSADAMPDLNLPGRVESLSPEVNDRTRTLTVKVALDNPDLVLRPGMFVRAQWSAGGAPGELWIPLAALRGRQGSQAKVAVLAGNQPQERQVELGRDRAGMVEVLSGLKDGELVLLPPAKEGGRP